MEKAKDEEEIGMNAIDAIHYIRSIIEVRFQRWEDNSETVCDGFSDGYETGVRYSYDKITYILDKLEYDPYLNERPRHKRILTLNGKQLDITNGKFSIWMQDETHRLFISDRKNHFTVQLKKYNWINKKVYHFLQDLIIKMFRCNRDVVIDIGDVMKSAVKEYYDYKVNHRKHKK